MPTIAEVGFPGVRAVQWAAAFAPAATPPEIIETLHQAFVKAMGDAGAAGGVRQGRHGSVPPQSSVDEAKDWLKQEMASWKQACRRSLAIVVDE